MASLVYRHRIASNLLINHMVNIEFDSRLSLHCWLINGQVVICILDQQVS
ncbi:hypothetical protein P3J6_110319 [Pseudoalteromonas sp. 3J6]|nr:hypothetical protein P3J6_110319 [Pseudoalteromonas sp. 3J6]